MNMGVGQGIEERDLVHCVYSSTEAVALSPKAIAELLDVARTSNSSLGITGMLLYDKGAFFQVLEGPGSVVDKVLEKIKHDNRHENFVKLIQEDIEQREFSDWTMGYSGVKSEELRNIDGLNDFFGSGKRYIDLDEGRAKTLLKGFKSGKWRASIE